MTGYHVPSVYRLALLSGLLCGIAPAQESGTVSGRVRLERAGARIDGPVRIVAVPAGPGRRGSASKEDLFAALADPARTEAVAGNDGSFRIAGLDAACALVAFADLDRDGRWDPGTPEPFGWFQSALCARFDLLEPPADEVEIVLRAPTPLPAEPRRTEGGALRRVRGLPVLQLTGDARTRGLAHGRLLAPQIVDFFRFYVLEDRLASLDGQAAFAAFLDSHFAYPEEYVTECEAVIEGMRASGADLRIPELGRDFERVDLYAINAYIETRAMRSSCTQFACWGERTKGTDVDGGTITGRNMDGEIDVRRVTVSHFLLFAVTPTDPGRKRYVSMMWPGFVGTITGINEDGFQAMENAGGTGPGPVVDRLVPISWTMRETLARLGADATPSSVQALVDRYDNAAGAVSGPGCIVLFAMPSHGQAAPAFVFEGDRFGDAIRLPGAVAPRLEGAILASNHHLAYGVDPQAGGPSFGRAPSWSSAWRYEAGRRRLEAWDRTGVRIGTTQMRDLLQLVAHGTTEHSIVTRPNAREFDVALASLRAEPWDAPYREWTTFRFDELFADAPERD